MGQEDVWASGDSALVPDLVLEGQHLLHFYDFQSPIMHSMLSSDTKNRQDKDHRAKYWSMPLSQRRSLRWSSQGHYHTSVLGAQPCLPGLEWLRTPLSLSISLDVPPLMNEFLLTVLGYPVPCYLFPYCWDLLAQVTSYHSLCGFMFGAIFSIQPQVPGSHTVAFPNIIFSTINILCMV